MDDWIADLALLSIIFLILGNALSAATATLALAKWFRLGSVSLWY